VGVFSSMVINEQMIKPHSSRPQQKKADCLGSCGRYHVLGYEEGHLRRHHRLLHSQHTLIASALPNNKDWMCFNRRFDQQASSKRGSTILVVDHGTPD